MVLFSFFVRVLFPRLRMKHITTTFTQNLIMCVCMCIFFYIKHTLSSSRKKELWHFPDALRLFMCNLSVCVCLCRALVKLTPQNTSLGTAGGSKMPQKRSQTLLVHLLVSSPINTWLLPARQTLKRQSENQDHYEKHCRNITCASVRTYCEDRESSRRPFSQQLIQLLFGDGVHNETEDKEERKEN